MSEFYRDSGGGTTESLGAEGADTTAVVLDRGPATVLLSGTWSGTLTLQQRPAADDGESWIDADGGNATFTTNGAHVIDVPAGFAWRLIFATGDYTSGSANARIVQ